MRKSILLGLLCLVSVLAVACGDGNNSATGNGTGCGGDTPACGEDAPAADPMAFYKKEGNFTLSKTSMKMKMGDDWKDQPVTFSRTEVVKVDGNKITIKTTMFDADMKETYSGESEMDLTPKEATGCAGEAPKIVEEEIEVKAGKFNCQKMETEAAGNKTTSWTSNGISVKSVTKGDTMEMEMELQEYKND